MKQMTKSAFQQLSKLNYTVNKTKTSKHYTWMYIDNNVLRCLDWCIKTIYTIPTEPSSKYKTQELTTYDFYTFQNYKKITNITDWLNTYYLNVSTTHDLYNTNANIIEKIINKFPFSTRTRNEYIWLLNNNEYIIKNMYEFDFKLFKSNKTLSLSINHKKTLSLLKSKPQITTSIRNLETNNVENHSNTIDYYKKLPINIFNEKIHKLNLFTNVPLKKRIQYQSCNELPSDEELKYIKYMDF